MQGGTGVFERKNYTGGTGVFERENYTGGTGVFERRNYIGGTGVFERWNYELRKTSSCEILGQCWPMLANSRQSHMVSLFFSIITLQKRSKQDNTVALKF